MVADTPNPKIIDPYVDMFGNAISKPFRSYAPTSQEEVPVRTTSMMTIQSPLLHAKDPAPDLQHKWGVI
jgi:hypothetical protein